MSFLTSETPPPGGLVARNFGGFGGGLTYVYWVQAIYPWGKSVLAQSNTLTNVNGPTPGAGILIEWNSMTGAIGYNVYRTTSTTAPTNSGLLAPTSSNGFTDTGLITPGTASPGTLIVPDGLRMAYLHYDFAVDGGAIGVISPTWADTIPAHAILYGGVANSTTAFTGAGATVAIGTAAGSAANSLLTATAITSFTLDAVVALAVGATPIKTTAAGLLQLTIATDAVTAGVLDVMVIYFMPIGA